MGTPLNLSDRMPEKHDELRVLNLGAGYCASEISEQIPRMTFKELVNVEVWPNAYMKLQALRFNTIHTDNVLEDALSYVRNISPLVPFDVVLLIDVLEHFTKEDGLHLLRHCKRIGLRVVIFLPIGVCIQDALEGNPYQKHQSTWVLEDFRDAQVEYFPRFHRHFNPPVDAAWVIYDIRYPTSW